MRELAGRWAVTAETFAARKAALDALKPPPPPEQLELDFEAPDCKLCGDEFWVECGTCDVCGCQDCDGGRVKCACDSDDDEAEDDGW